MEKDVFELNGEYFIYAVGPDGEAMGDALAGPFKTPEEAQAELTKQDPSEGTTEPAPMEKGAPATPKRMGQKSLGDNTMPNDTATELAALKNQVSALTAQIAAKGVQVGETREAVNAFKNLGENMRAIKTAYVSEGETVHPRLKELAAQYKAATGLNEGVGSEGGFLLEPTITRELLMPMTSFEKSPFVSRARKLPVGANSNSGWINGVDETSRATGSRWGGIVGYRLAEAAQKTASKPAFKRLAWQLKKYAVLMYATDELLQDITQLSSIFNTGAGEELAFMANDDLLNGTGLGGPLGILNSNSIVSQAARSGQTAATVINGNIIDMWSRLLPRYRPNAVWFINSEVEPQLDQLSIPAGTAALEPRYVTYGSDGVMRIKGRPVVVTEFNAALGTIGDIVLANFDDYLFWERGAEFATSIHLRFDYDEQVFRGVYRCDGLPATPKITPYKGTATQSAFVALATRS